MLRPQSNRISLSHALVLRDLPGTRSPRTIHRSSHSTVPVWDFGWSVASIISFHVASIGSISTTQFKTVSSVQAWRTLFDRAATRSLEPGPRFAHRATVLSLLVSTLPIVDGKRRPPPANTDL